MIQIAIAPLDLGLDQMEDRKAGVSTDLEPRVLILMLGRWHSGAFQLSDLVVAGVEWNCARTGTMLFDGFATRRFVI